jgi:hypothetical protein
MLLLANPDRTSLKNKEWFPIDCEIEADMTLIAATLREMVASSLTIETCRDGIFINGIGAYPELIEKVKFTIRFLEIGVKLMLDKGM